MAVVLTRPKSLAASKVVIHRPPVTGLGRLRKIGLLGSQHSVQYAPWDDPTWELWGHASSRFYYERQPERYFELHRKACWVMAHKQDRYLNWLKHNTIPIMLQELDPDVPAGVRYPKERILAEFRPYFTSQAAWMIALALTEGVTHLGVFGVNYSAESERQTQRGSTEYWLGVAEAKGVQIVLPPHCTLLQVPKELYGYESHDETGRLVPAYRPHKVTVEVPGKKESIALTVWHPGDPIPKRPDPPSGVSAQELAKDRRATPKNIPPIGVDTPPEWFTNLPAPKVRVPKRGGTHGTKRGARQSRHVGRQQKGTPRTAKRRTVGAGVHAQVARPTKSRTRSVGGHSPR